MGPNYFKSTLRLQKVLLQLPNQPEITRTCPMFDPGPQRGASKPPQLLILSGHRAEAAKTFAYNLSASVRRQTKFVKQKYLHKYRQLEERFLNSSQGPAGLIFAVPDIPAHITSTELVSALNDTLA